MINTFKAEYSFTFDGVKSEAEQSIRQLLQKQEQSTIGGQLRFNLGSRLKYRLLGLGLSKQADLPLALVFDLLERDGQTMVVANFCSSQGWYLATTGASSSAYEKRFGDLVRKITANPKFSQVLDRGSPRQDI